MQSPSGDLLNREPVAPSDSRTRILEAAIEILSERGYSATSTRSVANRAGVSQGALQHHFPIRSELCVSAMSFLISRLSREFVDAVPDVPEPIERFGAILDRLFLVFSGPTFVAGLELRLAARTDHELRDSLRGLDSRLDEMFRIGAKEMLPELVDFDGFESLLATTLASLRGIALTEMDPSGGGPSDWVMVRSELIASAVRIGSES